MNPNETKTDMPVIEVGMYKILGNALFYGEVEYQYLICVAKDQETAINIAQAFIDADKVRGF